VRSVANPPAAAKNAYSGPSRTDENVVLSVGIDG
jgi:hypothetical protein